MVEPTAHQAMFCKGCWDQMKAPIPIGGLLSMPFKLFGVTRSKMNPNICTICERAFSVVKKRRHFSETATILFSDIRGFTHLSESMDPVALSELVGSFQDRCAQSIWGRDGIVNKQMGDGLMAIFNFPIKAPDHAARAVAAAVDIQRSCKRLLPDLARQFGLDAAAVGVGVGIHTGTVEIGEFGSSRSDFTALGSVVNLAARLESTAQAGEIVLSADAAAKLGEGAAEAPRRNLKLKGIDTPVEAVVLKPV